MRWDAVLVRRLLILGMVILVFLAGCGGGSSSSENQSIVIAVFPSLANIVQGGNQNFSSVVTGSSNIRVTWSVQEGAAGGTITSSGQYTAPNAAGSFHIIVTSQADSTKSATAIVNVPAVAVSVQPGAVSMTTGESITLNAQVSGTVNAAVVWSVLEGSGGQVSSSGNYTAPGSFGVFHVVATSQADTSKNGVVIISVGAVSVSVAPSNDVLGPSGVRQFSATVASAIQQAVTWSVQEGTTGGSITVNGLYTAPNQLGNYHAVATSVVDPSKSATATVAGVANGFRPTGNMSTGRSAHSATTLQGGKVLIAGGNGCLFSTYYFYYSGSCSLNSAEVYDPANGTFTKLAVNMSTTRDMHTATLLADGRVLLAGGSGPSAELYDPGSGKFVPTGNMSVPRGGHTATLLNNGKVLVVGGNNMTGVLASAELYDPAAGTFATTGSLANARTFHTATLLGNGKVLIVGGSGSQNNAALSTAELYDPSTGTFSLTGNLGTARVDHTATLLNNNKVLVAGGGANGNTLASAELYDVAGAGFTATGMMVMKRESHVAAILSNGNVLLAGGLLGDFTVELYDPVAGVFTQTGSMANGRSLGAAAVLADGRVLVTGGSDTISADLYQ